MPCPADCPYNGPLGLSTGVVSDSQISASSTYPPNWDAGCSERYGRVYQPDGRGWCAKFKSASEWLQVDLGLPSKVNIINASLATLIASASIWPFNKQSGFALVFRAGHYKSAKIANSTNDLLYLMLSSLLHVDDCVPKRCWQVPCKSQASPVWHSLAWNYFCMPLHYVINRIKDQRWCAVNINLLHACGRCAIRVKIRFSRTPTCLLRQRG